jgi:YfiH family protein
MAPLSILRPNWPAPANVHAFTTTRQGGFSQTPFDQFNLGAFAGEDLLIVQQNRALLNALLPQAPFWIKQVHGTDVVLARGAHEGIGDSIIEADASVTTDPQTVLSILAADCMPVLFTNRSGTAVAAAHAGWRGLCAGVLENTVAKLLKESSSTASDVLAWIGPSISVAHYEVGAEVRAAFIESAVQFDYQLDDACFIPNRASGHDKYWADLPRIAKSRLQALGIDAVYGGDLCTFRDPERFYSYRRETPTGRFASLIWFNPKP